MGMNELGNGELRLSSLGFLLGPQLLGDFLPGYQLSWDLSFPGRFLLRPQLSWEISPGTSTLLGGFSGDLSSPGTSALLGDFPPGYQLSWDLGSDRKDSGASQAAAIERRLRGEIKGFPYY